MEPSAPLHIVVVGGGTAGCMVVSHLANNTDARITLIEPGSLSTHDGESRFFDVLADCSLLDPVASIPQARSLGGGSAVNGMLLTGDEPDFARGLTRMADENDIGVMGKFLLQHGGRFSRLWWNGGRWNPGRAVWHLQEEGRVLILKEDVAEILHADQVVQGVRTSKGIVNADMVVLCAGALHTPELLVCSSLMMASDVHTRNHYSLNFLVELCESSDASFDTAVVKEWESATGNKFLIHVYERSSAIDTRHGIMSIVHMNPLFGAPDTDAMREGSEELTRLSEILVGTREVLAVHPNHEVTPVSHPCCSCSTVLDDEGRLHGIGGVWVADASALKSIPHCTPAAPVTMEALRIARNIAKEIA